MNLGSTNPKVTTLHNFPELSAHLKNRVVVGIRPFRKGGIRLELEQLNNKNVIYNYGHGGAGVSLAPACGVQAAELATKAADYHKEPTVAVLGAGIVGLFSALECASRGLKVTVYANRIPLPNEKDILSMCTSEIAPGYWLPFHYEFSDMAQHKARTELSFTKYNEWTHKSKNIYEVDCYEQMTEQLFKESSPDFITKNSSKICLSLGSKQFPVIYFKTLQIHLQNFLQDLLVECQAKGIKFVGGRRFSNVDEVVSVPEKTIIVCLGLDCKRIFNDDKVYGVKGHLVELKNTTGLRGVFGFQYDGGDIGLYCFKEKVLVGLSREKNEQVTINQETVKQLQKRAYSFYQQLHLKPVPKL